MTSKKQTNDEGFLPGMGEFMQQEEEWMWENQKNERFFDSTNLPDAPGKQDSVTVTHAMYLLFPSRAELIRGFTALTQGARKGLAGKTKIVSINAMADVPDGSMTFLELWEMMLLGLVPEEKEQSDEAQAPI